jgi:apolipoprotein N-acyltransferase
VISHTGTFSREAQIATVHLRTRKTPYYYVGDWAAWLGVAATAWMVFRRRRA